MKSHTRRKCGKAFTQCSILTTQHQRIHTGEKPINAPHISKRIISIHMLLYISQFKLERSLTDGDTMAKPLVSSLTQIWSFILETNNTDVKNVAKTNA